MSEPRVLIWDIETSPNLGYVWEKWQTNVLEFEQEWYMLSVAWKWLGDPKVQCLALPDFPRYTVDPTNDRSLVKHAWELFDEADIVVAHNGKAFDTKKAQARMIVHGFDPPSPFREVDTLKLAKASFSFVSNRLGDVCQKLGIGGKIQTGGFGLWLGCLSGDETSWNTMKEYNANDVEILEQLYLRLRPWSKNPPNLAAIADDPKSCPRCNQSEHPLIRRKMRHNAATMRQQYQCPLCRGYCSGREVLKTQNLYV